jgi:hypothetical protein
MCKRQSLPFRYASLSHSNDQVFKKLYAILLRVEFQFPRLHNLNKSPRLFYLITESHSSMTTMLHQITSCYIILHPFLTRKRFRISITNRELSIVLFPWN